jgi:tRNA (guanine-N7-)-methyltransferase
MSFDIARGRTLQTEGSGIEWDELPAFDAADASACRLDPRTWYADPARPFEIEIGCGKGTFLVQEAPLRPAVNYLGIEWAGEFYRFAADRVRRRGLDNVRILHGDATQFVRYWCADGVADVIHLYFSDPWPKKRHHKRRVLRDETVADFHRVLREGGQLRLVTDHDELWAWYEGQARRHADLFSVEDFRVPDSARTGEVVGSNFERKFAAEQRSFRAMTLVKRDTICAEATRHAAC